MPKTKKERTVRYKKKKHRQFSGRKERLLQQNTTLQEKLVVATARVTTLEHSNSLLRRSVHRKSLDSNGRRATTMTRNLTSTYECCTMPSEGCVPRFNFSRQVSQLRVIPFSSIKLSKDPIGKGVFGKCYSGFMSSHISVCIKVFRTDDHLGHTFPVEAVLTSKLCHSNLPWLYGLSEHGPRKMLVLSFHGVDGRSCTVHRALHTDCKDLTVEINWKIILLGSVSALKYIHDKNILHNDIKSDNIMINSKSSIPQSILIDFGKGCFIADGKAYKLSLAERRRYAIEHPQVAPDLRDGHCRQSVYSDVYSLGRVIKQINDKFLKIPFVASYASFCTLYAYSKRPSTDELFNSMHRMLKPTS